MTKTNYPSKPVDAWWLTEQGIKNHFHEQREAEMLRHREATLRINDEELSALAAFDAWVKK